MSTAAETVAFSSKGQVVIPRRLRKKFGILQGTKAVVEAKDDSIILRPITKEYIGRQFGKFRGKNLLKSLSDEKRAERER